MYIYLFILHLVMMFEWWGGSKYNPVNLGKSYSLGVLIRGWDTKSHDNSSQNDRPRTFIFSIYVQGKWPYFDCILFVI